MDKIVNNATRGLDIDKSLSLKIRPMKGTIKEHLRKVKEQELKAMEADPGFYDVEEKKKDMGTAMAVNRFKTKMLGKKTTTNAFVTQPKEDDLRKAPQPKISAKSQVLLAQIRTNMNRKLRKDHKKHEINN